MLMNNETWPALPLSAWKDTYATVHMWTQIVGKICLALTPRTNHFWNSTLRVTSRGLTTPLMPYRDRVFTIAFDFVAHELLMQSSDGKTETISLEPRTVADFYGLVMAALRRLTIDVRIKTMPVEVPNPIRFETDVTHQSYEREAATTFWQAPVGITPVF